ncbi:MAG: FGGY family carbohydrate kinase [Oscillospiraceae bacterium]
MKSVGLDIGTSSICAVLIDADTGELCKKLCRENKSSIQSESPWEKLQNPKEILELCKRLLEELLSDESDVAALGVTGQMHGILYLDHKGSAISPLYTWQDGRGNLPFKNGLSFSQYLKEKTGYEVPTGYGMATHFYNGTEGLIDERASCFCSIGDYVAMSLGGEKKPLLHPGTAASLGMYDIKNGCFDFAALEAVGMDVSLLPRVERREKGSGYSKGKIPVCLALGDNQASFFGSVGNESGVLVNVGTGSQISVLTKEFRGLDIGECRPYIDGSYLCVGSSLCGGYAYSLLHRFFAESGSLFFGSPPNSEEIYEQMNNAAAAVYDCGRDRLRVNTQFKGTRKNPDKRGEILNLGEENFRPGDLALGVLRGICDELYEFFTQLSPDLLTCKSLVGSGNGIRKNPLLRKIISDKFQCGVKIPKYSEEAAYGSALFALYCIGSPMKTRDLSRLIKYEE